MIGHLLAVVGGTALAMGVLISALETVVLPRDRFTRIARFVFAVADRVLVHRWGNERRQANRRALYAPIALVSLPLVWMLMVTVGFSFIFWGIKAGTGQHSFEISGSSLFTLGFAEPHGSGRIWLTFVEATIGLGLVALLISYLPTIYAAHRQREKGISVLRPFAGTPPSPIEMLANLQRLGTLDDPELWKSATSWILDLDQTHTSFPALCYFPESDPERSWVASVGSLLDAAGILISAADFRTEAHAAEELKGPMLTLAYGMPTLVRISRSAGLPVRPSRRLVDLLVQGSEPAPEISVRRAEYIAALDDLHTLVAVPEEWRESCWRRFAWIRSGYAQALRGLAGLTRAPSAPWTTDRPAGVSRPRLVLSRPVEVDWDRAVNPSSTTASAERADPRHPPPPGPSPTDG